MQGQFKRTYTESERARVTWPDCERCGGRMYAEWQDVTPYGMPKGEREYLPGLLRCSQRSCTAG